METTTKYDDADYYQIGGDISEKPQYAPNQIIVKFRQAAANAIENQQKANISAKKLKLSSNLNRLNAKHRAKSIKPIFKDFKKHRQNLKALQSKNKSLLTKKEKHILRRLKRAPKNAKVPDLSKIYKLELELEDGQSLKEVVAAYNNDPDVEYAELNYIVSINKTPNDPLYSVQWSLNNTGQMYPESGDYNPPPGTPDADIDAPEAWNIFAGSSEIVVAVIDSGVDYNHRDLVNNMWTNAGEIPDNDIDDDGNGYIDDVYGYDFRNSDSDPADDNGHGTHCSGTIAAKGNNGLDITGINWNAKIMALKFLSSGGSGSISDAIEAFYYAIDNGADVTSNSWGGGSYSQTMQDAIDYAHSQGVTMVASAGNDGNTNPNYPAYHENMISVAATDSDDQKATFSTYGDWVDIAAPGVDILSLRASGTPGRTPYDNYTTIASGTSMACPHVAGACALMLSVYPEIDINELELALFESADPISPEICASGRLNVFEALLNISVPMGRIFFDNDFYSCSDLIGVWLLDSDLSGNGTHQVTLDTAAGDFETVTLTEIIPAVGIFKGTISTDTGLPVSENGTIETSHNQTITVIYEDANDGTGNPATVIDTATADCEPPVIFNVQIDPRGPEPEVTFDTNEPATVRVLCGTACGEPYIIDVNSLDLTTNHTIRLPGVSPLTDYYFIIEANDVVSNHSVDNNSGLCYTFTTDNGPREIHVPGDALTIQEAIDISWNGGTVFVADDTYTGEGNRDIDFRGKAITVRSENGPENCIIDCNGSRLEYHRGFYFHSGEDTNSVLDGFTITNGYAHKRGGGISCEDSSPTITNCIITGNSAGDYGGGIYGSNGIISNCTISENSLFGIYNRFGGGLSECNGPITNCVITGNSADEGGGLFNCNNTISNCTISSNRGESRGGGLYACNGLITNCTISRNFSGDPAGGGLLDCEGTISNCIITGNIGAAVTGIGNSLINCVIAGHKTSPELGITVVATMDGQIINCIIWDNRGESIFRTMPSYSCIEDGSEGVGCIDSDPCFVTPGYWNSNGTPENYDDFWVDGDYRLRPESPCIDVGSFIHFMDLPSTDYDGNTRMAGSQIDMGCYEANSSPDSDDDWLADSSEPGYENDPDRDSDGILDGIELLQGTDINLPDPLRQWNIPSDIESIQEALFFSRDGETIVLNEGTYYQNIYIGGRNITLTGTNPDDPNVVAATIINGDMDANPDTSYGGTITMKGTENTNCRISGLTITGDSVGICGSKSIAEISNCVISNNGFGGLSLCDGAINNCVITGNSGYFYGGGLRLCNGTISNCIISNNSASSQGGGLWGCQAMISNCVIVGNSAPQGDGFEFCRSPITNCIIWNNSLRYSSVPTYSCVQGGSEGIGNIDNDPCFVDSAGSDYHLKDNSPCINTGDPDYIPEPNETDLDGMPRIMGGRIDMGAYEFLSPIEAEMKCTPQTLNCKSKGKWVKAHITLPEGFSVDDVDINTPAICEPIGTESEYMNVFINDDGLVEIEAAFSRRDFCEAFSGYGSVEIGAFGYLTTGQMFLGTDTILIIDNRFQQLAAFASQWLQTDCTTPDWCNGQDLDHNKAVNFIDFSIF